MFVGKDVATALGYANTLKAIRDHVDSEDKGVNEMVTPGGTQKLIFINESGLYSLILSSKLPQAKQPAIFFLATFTSVTSCPAASAAFLYSSAIQAVLPLALGEPCKIKIFIISIA